MLDSIHVTASNTATERSKSFHYRDVRGLGRPAVGSGQYFCKLRRV